MNRRTNPAVLAIGLIACAALLGACGSSDDSASTSTAKREAAGACPNIRSQTYNLYFKNTLDRDVTYSASPRDCKFWSESGFPSHYNGLELPASIASDPGVSRSVQFQRADTSLSMQAAPTRMTFTLRDGTRLGPASLRLNSGSGNDAYVEVFNDTKGDFERAGTAELGTVGGRTVNLVTAAPRGGGVHTWYLTLRYGK